MKTIFKSLLAITVVSLVLSSCGNGGSSKKGALSSSAAEKVYVAPGEHDEFYAFVSGGHRPPIFAAPRIGKARWPVSAP